MFIQKLSHIFISLIIIASSLAIVLFLVNGTYQTHSSIDPSINTVGIPQIAHEREPLSLQSKPLYSSKENDPESFDFFAGPPDAAESDIEKKRQEFKESMTREDSEEPEADTDSHMELADSIDSGKLYYKGNLAILVLKGTYFEMGMQYGQLVGSQITEILKLFDRLASKETIGLLPEEAQRAIRRRIGRLFRSHLPKSSTDLMHGIVEGAKIRNIELDYDDLIFLNSLIDLGGIGSTNLSFSLDSWNALATVLESLRKEMGLGWIQQNCNSFAAFGSRTIEGKTFQTRNTDITVGMGLEDFPLAIVYFPRSSSGHSLIPFASAGFAGQIGVSTGLNASGIGLGQVWAFSNQKSIGRPWSLAMIDVMASSSTATQAAKYLSEYGPHTYGNNFVFADASGDAAVLELNAKTYDIFGANDRRELSESRMKDGRIYAVPLRDAVVRADFSMSRKIRIDQTSARGPEGWPLEAGSYQKRYAGQIKRILAYERMGRKIGVHESMVISRATADRGAGNLQLAVYSNTDRKLWVAYATRNKDGTFNQAYQNDFVYIPFDKILRDEGYNFQ